MEKDLLPVSFYWFWYSLMLAFLPIPSKISDDPLLAWLLIAGVVTGLLLTLAVGVRVMSGAVRDE